MRSSKSNSKLSLEKALVRLFGLGGQYPDSSTKTFSQKRAPARFYIAVTLRYPRAAEVPRPFSFCRFAAEKHGVTLFVAIMFVLIFGTLGASMMFRARAMRAFAARHGLRYVGPSAPKWFGIPKIKPQLPIPRNWYPANEIRQVLNVIEGESGGVRVLIFDSLLDIGRGEYGTFIACKTESNPFQKDAYGERVLKSRDWRVLYSMTTLIPWGIDIRHLERHLKDVCSHE